MDSEEIRKQFDRLPDNIKQAVVNLDMGKIADDLRQKYNLHVDQVGKIAEEITLTMVGLTRPDDFNEHIRTKTGLAKDIVNLITYDLNQQIFLKIRRELEQLAQAKITPTETSITDPRSNQTQATIKKSLTPQTFTEKMSGLANVPKQEVVVNPQTGDNKETKPVRDPYREPI